jgi:hypothetical protein
VLETEEIDTVMHFAAQVREREQQQQQRGREGRGSARREKQ